MNVEVGLQAIVDEEHRLNQMPAWELRQENDKECAELDAWFQSWKAGEEKRLRFNNKANEVLRALLDKDETLAAFILAHCEEMGTDIGWDWFDTSTKGAE